jgi:hypothetical protein
MKFFPYESFLVALLWQCCREQSEAFHVAVHRLIGYGTSNVPRVHRALNFPGTENFLSFFHLHC